MMISNKQNRKFKKIKINSKMIRITLTLIYYFNKKKMPTLP